MIEPLQFFPTNWIDGMKIRRQHFSDNDNAFWDTLRDVSAIRTNSFNYGLLSPLADESVIQCWFGFDNQSEWHIRITSCRAITPAGARIEITRTVAEKLTNALALVETTYRPGIYKNDEVFYILINVSLFERQVGGVLLSDEIPPRYPFTQPTYSLSVAPASQLPRLITGNYQLIVGQVLIKDGLPVLSADYIPPCTTVKVHPRLVDFYGITEKFLSLSEFNLVSIIQKIHFRQQQNNLANAVLQVAVQCIGYINSVIGQFKHLMLEEPPINTLILISGMARAIKNTIDQMVNTGKEELLIYLSEWCTYSPNEIEVSIIDCANLEYIHNNILRSVIPAESFMKLFTKLFVTLQQMDFIGKRQDANIFVKEETVADTAYLNKHKIRNSFFAD